MNLLKSLAENSTISNLAFKQVRKYLKENKVSFIAIFLDKDGNIQAKEYTEPMAIVRREDYQLLVNNALNNALQNAPAKELQKVIEDKKETNE